VLDKSENDKNKEAKQKADNSLSAELRKREPLLLGDEFRKRNKTPETNEPKNENEENTSDH
jgi:hypothetical protein